ncbi:MULTISPECIES: hypothetical protein [Aerosakkonema]|uniref:hypothetical protein n=1 Tax=Aerosakkonema TaxID=1246629 RepID=UPI0035B78A3B
MTVQEVFLLSKIGIEKKCDRACVWSSDRAPKLADSRNAIAPQHQHSKQLEKK